MKKVIQIGGTVRSGTTLLGLILANQPNGIALGEVLHLFHPYNQEHFQKIGELEKDKRWKFILNDKPENLYKNIFHYFDGIEVITDSSKDPFWFKKIPETTVYVTERILTYKTPQELINSFRKRNQTNWRKTYVNYYRRFFSLFPDMRSVMINEVLTDTETLKTLCAEFNLETYTSRLNYWEKDQPNFFGSPTIKKNKIEIQHDNSNSNIVIDGDLQLIFQHLEKINIRNQSEKRPPFSVDRLKYNALMLKMLKLKDDLVVGKSYKAVIKDNLKFGI